MKVAILGCGPAGLLCAHAVLQETGERPVIYSRKAKSYIPGSQYLHEAIPDLTSHYPECIVQYTRMGTREGYAGKVYGDPNHPCGWENYNQLYPGWNLIHAYDLLWDYWEDNITDMEVTANNLPQIIKNSDLVITTLPAPDFCLACCGIHKFGGTPFWIKPLPLPSEDEHRNICIYNGNEEDWWYRWSILGDRCSIEATIPMPEALRGYKVTETDCDCWPEVVKAGRWATWKHGVLLTDAYKTAKEACGATSPV